MRKFIYSYFLIIVVVSAVHFYLIDSILSKSESNFIKESSTEIENDAEFLTQQMIQNINTLISEIKGIPVQFTAHQLVQSEVENLFDRRREIFHLNYFSADGNLKYSSKQAAIEWHSNLLNSDWFRGLIKNWQVTITNIHKSPVSPFPQVIAIAVPITQKQTIDGFWLVYLDIKYTQPLFTSMSSNAQGISSVWFDGNGEIIHISSKENTITESFIKSNGWWYKINESVSDSINWLTADEKSKSYLYSTVNSSFENVQLVVLQDMDKTLVLYYDYKKGIIIFSVILQLIIMVVIALVLWQWQKQKEQLAELLNVNNLLETKSGALVNTNEMLDKLVYELDDQKKQLLQAKNNLERVQKYLDFLTLPVIALDNDFNFEFMNRAAETEFNYIFAKISKKPVERFLQIKNKNEFDTILNQAKKKLERQEASVSIHVKEGIKSFMVSCDYLLLGDWQGYIVTFSDLTELLQLQENIKIQNVFLEKASYLSELFLLPETENEILTKVISVLKDYCSGKGMIYYQNDNAQLSLKSSVQDNHILPPKILPQGSIAAGAVLSGEAVIIKSKDEIPENVNPVEKKINFKRAIFYPMVIDKKSVGLLIVVDPKPEIVMDFENTLEKLLIHFKIGISALMSKTRLESANEELKRSTALRAQLLRSMTHGLKTPLSTIKGYVKLIQLKFISFLKGKPELHKFINKLDTATEELNNKIIMYLDMARINRNDLHFEKQQIKIPELMHPLITQLDQEAETKKIKIDYSNGQPNNVSILIDLQRIIFALKTIFINALKYAPEKDKVIVSVLKKGEYLSISFEDHGKKINTKHLSLIGAEFLPEEVASERLHYSDSLAMALAVKIIKLAQGELKIKSSDKKTVHIVKLPVN